MKSTFAYITIHTNSARFLATHSNKISVLTRKASRGIEEKLPLTLSRSQFGDTSRFSDVTVFLSFASQCSWVALRILGIFNSEAILVGRFRSHSIDIQEKH